MSFNKANLDEYFKELGKLYKKSGGKYTPAEITLIGGASILCNYGFRNTTNDVDAIIYAASSLKDAINQLRDKYELPNGWLNDDFKNTSSYTPKLLEYSKYYKTYSNVLTVRTISSEYLIAMKLKSGRSYKNDLSDIIGIIGEENENSNAISYEDVNRAIMDLYGTWDGIASETVSILKEALATRNYKNFYQETRKKEKSIGKGLKEIEDKYPNLINENNLSDIVDTLQNFEESAKTNPNEDEEDGEMEEFVPNNQGISL